MLGLFVPCSTIVDRRRFAMSSPRFSELLAQPTLAYKQRIEKEDRACRRHDLETVEGIASTTGDPRSPAANRLLRGDPPRPQSSASNVSVPSSTTFSNRLRRLEVSLEEERKGREEVHAQLARLQTLIEAHIVSRSRDVASEADAK